ncbi:hypothetical protein OGR47_09740 [Methylocystis sp. MJC1]|uniref:hypothetical protein n=1 Tax=Methylocystis sp. MJC1 TaxID=2654282 RepID=UPI0013EAAD59|nr:hypothetical protein [Methylocystis sp. MJC1]KAF2992129.1 hypothetical protein MJC1_00501 [Methylocystis sp. MJC1]MBU6527270.1 hypothetical protein [Methylocystis sp. MJC1]UZX10227.1 hypothetical protein OGR47_09740 [Methylocystis sp. MJC1]
MTGDFADTRFDAPTVLIKIRANRLDLKHARACPKPHIAPRLARQHQRVHAIADDEPPQPEIVLSYGVSRTITGVLDRAWDDA